MTKGTPETTTPSSPAAPSQKEKLYQLMLESMKDHAIVLLDPTGIVVDWNVGAEEIFGWRDVEIVGQHFSKFFTPEEIDAGKPEYELKEVAAIGVGEDDNWLMRKDGSRFFASGVTTALRDDELRGYVKIVRDLTERKELENEAKRRADQLVEADRRKDEFLAMLSHELRNPLAPIMNALQIMQQDQTGRAVIQQARSVIERQVRQMTRLIDDLLDVTRITRGKVQLRKEQVELSGVLERAVETVKPMIEARQHTLTVSLPDEPIWLDADPARLEQIVSNLLANAAKYTEPGGRIWLSAMCQNQRAVISVRDEGVGIAPELLPHIFDLFTQAERTLDQSQGGLGVGLTLVKSLLELHGGTISARSDGPGKGSEFVVELPVTPLPKVTPPKVARSSEPIAAAALRVLVVDDNLDTADSLAMLLLLKGYDVTTANDGIKAVEVAMAFLPDVVLLDIGLPGADGNEVARRIRQQKELEGVVLVAMTGYGQDSDRQRSHAAGFDYHLVKPADPVKVQQLLAMLSPRA